MERKYPWARGKIFPVFNGIALDGFPQRGGFDSAIPSTNSGLSAATGGCETPLIVSVGRAVEKKGYGDLIEACRLLKADGLKFRCEIIGGGPLEAALQQRIDSAGLNGTVELLGPKPQAEVCKRLAAAQVFALACVEEAGGGADNLPTVIMEAMACGTPVVSTRLAGIPEMVSEGEDGLLVPPGNPPQLAAEIARLLRDPALAARIGNKGRQTAEEKFSIANTTRSLKQLLIRYGPVDPPEAARRFDPDLPVRTWMNDLRNAWR
jgi:glycosyltransferase involved in cell wall biosynthesis